MSTSRGFHCALSFLRKPSLSSWLCWGVVNKKKGGTQRRFTPHCRVSLSTWVRNHVNKLQACNAVRDAVASGGWRSRKACLTKVVETGYPSLLSFLATGLRSFQQTKFWVIVVPVSCGFRQISVVVGSQVSVCARRSTLHPTAMSEGELPCPCYTQWKCLVRSCGIFFRYIWYLCKCWPNYKVIQDDPSNNERLFVSHAWGDVLSTVVKVISQWSSRSPTFLPFFLFRKSKF